MTRDIMIYGAIVVTLTVGSLAGLVVALIHATRPPRKPRKPFQPTYTLRGVRRHRWSPRHAGGMA